MLVRWLVNKIIYFYWLLFFGLLKSRFDHYAFGSVGLLGTCLAFKWTGHASICFCCLCRTTLGNVHLFWLLYIVCHSFFLFYSMLFNRHPYLFFLPFKRIMHLGVLVSRIHNNIYMSLAVWHWFCFSSLRQSVLNIFSLNVNGLNSPIKRTRKLEYLHRKSISCALIQESHLKQCNVARFQNKYYKLAAFSCALNKTRGVLILVDRKLHLTIEHTGNDDEGRFFIRCKIHNDRLALVSIYCLNEADSTFFTNISNILLEQIDCPIVMGGDFNAVLNPALDKSHPDTTANPSSELLNKFITELNVIDLWRIQNTTSKDFTFFF